MPPAARHLYTLDSRSFERRLATNPLVILPIGALEAHGPHLPLGADQIQAEATALALADRVDGLVAPTVAYGSAPGARRFPGTVSLSMAELETHVAGILGELARSGVRRILVLSGHAERGHMAALREAADVAMRAHPGSRIVVLSDYDFVYELRGKESPPTDGHAGLLETGGEACPVRRGHTAGLAHKGDIGRASGPQHLAGDVFHGFQHPFLRHRR